MTKRNVHILSISAVTYLSQGLNPVSVFFVLELGHTLDILTLFLKLRLLLFKWLVFLAFDDNHLGHKELLLVVVIISFVVTNGDLELYELCNILQIESHKEVIEAMLLSSECESADAVAS